MLLEPEVVAGELSQRLAAVQAHLEHFDAQLEEHRRDLPRIAQIETEYQRALADAEVRWLRCVIDDLKSGKLSWTEEQFAPQGAADYSQADGP